MVEIAPETAQSAGATRRYLFLVGSMTLAFALAFIFAVSSLRPDGNGAAPDHPFEITRGGDPSWYRNFGGRSISQIQDQDIFYSNAGSSVTAAKSADIIILGPSFVSYAVDRDTLSASPLLHDLKIYNMAFVGIRGGEFSRRVIERWNIRPPLWVVNVDDQFVHFFSSDLNVTLGPAKMPIEAIHRGRVAGYLAVAGRNVRWRIEDTIASLRGENPETGIYRSVANGDMALDADPTYLADDNKPMLSARDPRCHTHADVVNYARTFLNAVGGRVVFTVVPHSQSCVGQAAELAKALNVELIVTPFAGLTTIDGGGHLDKKGAEKFTSNLAAELVKTDAFNGAFAAKLADLK